MEQQERKGLILKQPSQISTAINNPKSHPAILEALQTSIKKAIDSPSFNQLIHSGANELETRQLLAVLISKYANMLTVGGNLNPNHPMEYAKEIISDWPTMSLDDFNILLANGVKGRYGQIFRFDIEIIYTWIAAYQDEYWEVKENLPRQPSALEMLPDEKLIDLQQVIAESEERIVMPLTDKEVLEEGQEKPKKPEYNPPDQAYLRTVELKIQYGRECTDLHTGRVLPNMPTFETWIKDKL